jgi:hypothetical protein
VHVVTCKQIVDTKVKSLEELLCIIYKDIEVVMRRGKSSGSGHNDPLLPHAIKGRPVHSPLELTYASSLAVETRDVRLVIQRLRSIDDSIANP